MKCKFRDDDDGHHYIVPSDRVEEFERVIAKDWDDRNEEEELWISSCATGGAQPDVEFEWPQSKPDTFKEPMFVVFLGIVVERDDCMPTANGGYEYVRDINAFRLSYPSLDIYGEVKRQVLDHENSWDVYGVKQAGARVHFRAVEMG